jgi:outer membrane lipoprotein SlyB
MYFGGPAGASLGGSIGSAVGGGSGQPIVPMSNNYSNPFATQQVFSPAVYNSVNNPANSRFF